MATSRKTEKYQINDALFLHNKDEFWLVVSRTPPAWTILNKSGYEIVSALPTGLSFDVYEVYDRLRGRISQKVLKSFLEELALKGIIIKNSSLPLVQNNRAIAINGLYIEITPQCNLHCEHCYVDSTSKLPETLLTKEQILNTVFQLEPPAEIGFSGGEPLLRPDCMSMIREVVSRGYLCTLLTNGLLITEILAKELSELKVTVQVSLEGNTPSINDQLRGYGSFTRIKEAIQCLIRNDVNVRVSFTPTKLNYRNFNELLSFINSIGVRSLHICTFSPQGRGKENSKSLMLDTEELYEFQNIVYEASKGFDIMGNLPETLDLGRVGHLWDRCPLGGSIHVGYDGSIYPCEIAAVEELIIGNIKKSTLKEALLGEAAKVFLSNSRERIRSIPECAKCEWKHFCGGGCLVLSLVETGNLNTTDYLCNCRKKWFEKILWGKCSSLSEKDGD